MALTLSKSDFKVARTCPTKLYYKKQHYPSTLDTNAYLRLLAEGGFMVEKMAKLLQIDGVEAGSHPDPEVAAAKTRALLAAHDNITLFEATVIHDGRMARIDILRKRGATLDLIEVKAKSFSSAEDEQSRAEGGSGLFWSSTTNKKTKVRTDTLREGWREYLEDVTFQTLILRKCFPEATVRPFLMMPDKSRVTLIEGIHTWFQIRRPGDGFRSIEVDFTGDLARLRADPFLVEVPVEREVTHLATECDLAAGEMLQSLRPALRRVDTPLSKDCSGCEYRHDEPIAQDGFRECWGALADVRPHIFDLYNMGTLGGTRNPLVNELIRKGSVSLFDIRPDQLVDANGAVGKRNVRQLIQLEHTRDQTEWFSPALLGILGGFSYPLHFIDFETSRMAIPYHAGMRPYEQIAFQWSCHTIREPGGALEHAEWINADDAFPNFAFARSLMEQVGTAGTLFMYATHENSVLRDIYHQMETYGHADAALKAWLEGTVKIEEGDTGRFIDMNALTLHHYFHPMMKGKTSAKNVSEAIWTANASLRRRFPDYVREKDGVLQSPYQALPPLEVAGVDTAVREGTGAMLAYQEMFYGTGKLDRDVRETWRQLLLQYCKLDTLVMVWLWLHWTERAGDSGAAVLRG